jgi:predicted CXXCH cytochrome family protein
MGDVLSRLLRMGCLLGMVLAVSHCSSDDGGGGDAAGPFAGGFLGLANVEQNVTECGECHESRQRAWENTAHAHAFMTLQNIGREGIENSCAPCHNVSDKGSPLVDDSVGFVAENGNSHLRNVECENCHGPGADHLADRDIKPIAPIAVDLDIGCGECHQDAHHPFVEEWLDSAHSESHLSGSNFGLNVASNPECAYCHVAQSFVVFIETEGRDRVITSDPEPITCVACHDPHGNGNDHQLRYVGDFPIVCGQCHQQGDTMIGETPHHPQANMLLGTAGFLFPGVVSPGPSTHGNINNNPDLCVGCHVVTSPFQGGDPPIAAQVGHTFEPIPVIDEETGERDFSNCADCHSNTAAVLAVWRAEIAPLVAELEAALEAVPEDQHDTEAYQGALFNFETFVGDKSGGVHNPPLTTILVESSLEALSTL